MKILNWYVTSSFLVAFAMAIGILTFGMTGANLVKVLDYVSQGISFWTFCQFTLYIMPIILTFTVPWAVMVAVMLVFGRMSADNEITAMRACGISILQIFSPILLITLILTGLCLYLQVEVGPPLLYKSRSLMSTAVMDQPMAIFEPGKPISYENTLIYIDSKEGENTIKGVQLYTLADANTVAQDVSAAYGEISADQEKKILTINLYDCMVSDRTNDSDSAINRLYMRNLQFNFNYGNKANAEGISIKPKYMRLQDLMGKIRMEKQRQAKSNNRDYITELEVEMNQRIAFALAPIAFLLLGMPLAIRTNRRETSIGLFLSLILAGVFFLSIILCESLSSYPDLYPQYLLWLPNIIFQLLGATMIMRISRR